MKMVRVRYMRIWIKLKKIFINPFNKRIVFVILSLFFHEVLCQMPLENQTFGNSTVEKSKVFFSDPSTENPVNENIFSNFVKTSRINGKTGIATTFGDIAVPLILEFEKPVIKSPNHKLMWLLQGGGGVTIETDSPSYPCLKDETSCPKLQKSKNKDRFGIFPYGAIGFKYVYFGALTASVTVAPLLSKSFTDFLTTISLGWNISKVHIELHYVSFQFFKGPGPFYVALSAGFPLKTW